MSYTKTSSKPSTSPRTMLPADEKYATRLPSAEIAGCRLWPSADLPSDPRLTSVVVPLSVSYTKMSVVWFVSSAGEVAGVGQVRDARPVRRDRRVEAVAVRRSAVPTLGDQGDLTAHGVPDVDVAEAAGLAVHQVPRRRPERERATVVRESRTAGAVPAGRLPGLVHAGELGDPGRPVAQVDLAARDRARRGASVSSE